MAEGGLPDVGARTAVHGEPVAALADDLDGTAGAAGLLGQESGEPGGVRGADGDAWTQSRAGEVPGLLVGDDPAPVQGDHAVRRAGRLLGVGGGEQHGAALVRVGPQRAVQPAALAGGEFAGRVVEDEGVRVGQQGAGQAEAPVHAAREGAEALVAQAHEADGLEDFVGPPDRNTGRGAQHPEVTAHGTRGMSGHVAEEHADLADGWAMRCRGRPRK